MVLVELAPLAKGLAAGELYWLVVFFAAKLKGGKVGAAEGAWKVVLSAVEDELENGDLAANLTLPA